MKLNRFFTNPFDDRQISVAELVAFATDHLQRLIAHNTGGRWDERISETSTALDALLDSYKDDLGGLGLRKSRKKALRTYRRGNLPARLAKIFAAVVACYGPRTPEVKECFPGGLTRFRRCRDDGLAAELKALITGLTTHVADLGPAVVAEATALATEWAALHTASETSTSSKAANEVARREARQQVQLALYLNLHHLALHHPRAPDRLSLYMQESLLKNRRSRGKK